MNLESSVPKCPQCRAVVPADAPQGLCPHCVLQGAIASTPLEKSNLGSTPPAIQAVRAAFPHLEILELIGRGGMGFVYQARQPKLDRLVALKLLAVELSSDPLFVERFNREARALARLNHPGIVAVYDFGVSSGFCYLLMEFVDGVNLRQAMETGRFTQSEALTLVPKICDAIQFAHEQGVLHRDIKPENILLDSQGQVKIADFGIAKLVGEDSPDLTLTLRGARLGTPTYMAPEQVEHPGTVDHRADIYSLGVVFYELLTGELPLGRFAPPSAKADLDARVDDIVMRALAKERELRQQTATEVKTECEAVTAVPRPPGVPPTSPPSLTASLSDKGFRFGLLLLSTVVGALLSIQTLLALPGLAGGFYSLAQSGPQSLVLTLLAGFGLVLLVRESVRHRHTLAGALRVQINAFIPAPDPWLSRSILLAIAGLIGQVMVGVGSLILIWFSVLGNPENQSMLVVIGILLTIALLAALRHRTRSAVLGNIPPAPTPKWMRRAAWWFLAMGVLSGLLPLIQGLGSIHVWHRSSLLLFTGLALFTVNRQARWLALAVNGYGLCTGLTGTVAWLWLKSHSALPSTLSLEIPGVSNRPEVASLFGLLESLAFLAGWLALQRADSRAAFGIPAASRTQCIYDRIALTALILAVVSLEWTQWKPSGRAAQGWTASPVKQEGFRENSARFVSPGPGAGDNARSESQPTSQAAITNIASNEAEFRGPLETSAKVRLEIARRNMDALRKRVEVGALAPRGPEILDGELDVKLALAEIKQDRVAAAKARMERAHGLWGITNAMHRIGKATKADVDTALSILTDTQVQFTESLRRITDTPSGKAFLDAWLHFQQEESRSRSGRTSPLQLALAGMNLEVAEANFRNDPLSAALALEHYYQTVVTVYRRELSEGHRTKGDVQQAERSLQAAESNRQAIERSQPRAASEPPL